MKRIGLSLLLLSWLTLSAGSASAEGPQLTRLSTTSNTVVWTSLVPDHPLVLSVVGGDFSVRSKFAPGESPSVKLQDAEGAPLPDGVYSWELRAVPLPSQSNAPSRSRSSRAEADPKAVRRPVQSGDFRIKNGSVVNNRGLASAYSR